MIIGNISSNTDIDICSVGFFYGKFSLSYLKPIFPATFPSIFGVT